jgi:hypothetical protein
MKKLPFEENRLSGTIRRISNEDPAPSGKNARWFVQRSRMEAQPKAPTKEYCGSSSAADIALELFNDELLLGNDGFYEIANGNHATYFACFDNRQMTDPYLGHQGHTLFDILLRLRIGNTRRHNLLDCGGSR